MDALTATLFVQTFGGGQEIIFLICKACPEQPSASWEDLSLLVRLLGQVEHTKNLYQGTGEVWLLMSIASKPWSGYVLLPFGDGPPAFIHL